MSFSQHFKFDNFFRYQFFAPITAWEGWMWLHGSIPRFMPLRSRCWSNHGTSLSCYNSYQTFKNDFYICGDFFYADSLIFKPIALQLHVYFLLPMYEIFRFTAYLFHQNWHFFPSWIILGPRAWNQALQRLFVSPT